MKLLLACKAKRSLHCCAFFLCENAKKKAQDQAVNSLHGQAVNSLPILCESNITQFHASASRLRKLLLALQAKRSFIVSRKETRLVRKNKRSTRLGRVVVAIAKEAQGRLVFSRKALPALLRLLEGAAVCPCLCFFFKHVSLVP